MNIKKILVVEDENIIALDIKSRLKNLGYYVAAVVPSGEEAIKVIEEVNPDLVLMDIALRGKINGLQAAESITRNYNIPVIFVTSFSDDNTLKLAHEVSPYGYLIKPFNEKELKIKIDNAF
ncbi:MAG: response regulator [Ignavibacteriaceae bacterium]